MKNPDSARAKDCLCQRGDVIAAYLFGSYVSGKAGAKSDLHIAVLLDDGVRRRIRKGHDPERR